MPRRCGLGCTPTRGVLHVFPNPDKFPEQFKAWVQVVSGQDECNFDYKKMRICDRHFTEKDRNRYNRLNALAVPSLFLHEQLAVQIPNEPGVSTSSMSEQAFSQPELSDNYQSSSDNLVQKLCASTSITSELALALDQPQTSNIEESLSGASPEVSHDHNYCKLLKKTLNARGWKKNMLLATSKKHVIYQKNIKNLRRQICRLRKRGKDIKSRLENAENLFNKSDFQKVVKDMTPAARMFTNMQYYQALKKPTGRRFKVEEKVLSLSLYKRSPKCYGLMSKYFVLPSTKSLKRLLAQIKLSPGINEIIFDKLKKTVSNLDTEDRLCTLIFDEMSIMPQVHYDSSKDELKGFTSHGKNQIANHALVFMVKGIKKHFKQPVAYYFTNSLNNVELKAIIKDVLKKVQETGLIVLCTVCDQSTINVSAINDLVKESKEKYLRKGKEMPLDFFEINKKKSFHFMMFLTY